MRRVQRFWPLVLAMLGSGCEGALGDPAGASPDLPGAHDNTDSPANDPDAPADVDRMNENPELFEIASKYFPGQAAAGGRKRMFRLTRQQIDLTTRALLPAHVSTNAVATLPRDPLQTNYEYADNLSINAANFTPYTGWVAQIASSVKAAPESVIDCGAGASSTCLTDQAKAFVRRAFRGVVSEQQLTHYADFFSESVTSVGAAQATADLVELTLGAPNYLFRDEARTDANNLLLPAQALQNLTYTLADAPPEALGLSSLTPEDALSTPESLQRTIDTVLASKAARDKLLRFFKAWLEIKEPAEFNIASSVFPEFTPAVASAVVAETDAFLQKQLGNAVPRLKDLTEAHESLISHDEAFLYGLNVGQTPSLTKLDPAQRLGIFTQPAVIASHSGPTTTRLVKRGVFFVRKVMCMPLGDPPQGVNTSVPADAGDTERKRIESVTANQPCAGCHAVINPFGFALENFDALGRYRKTDEKGKPIDSSISVGFLDEGKLSTSSPVDALAGFTRSYRFQQCFARQLFRFYTGREETPSDDPTLRRMFFDFANQQKQEIVGLLHTLAGSAQFSRRTEAP